MSHRNGRSLFCRPAIALIAFLFLSTIPSQAQKKDVKDVNVVNTPTVNVSTLPPVTGSVAITNTPVVTVANTPNVNVTSLPAVQLSGTAPLNVKNDPTTPLIIRDADNPAHHFFQQAVSVVVQDGTAVPLFPDLGGDRGSFSIALSHSGWRFDQELLVRQLHPARFISVRSAV